MRMAEADKVQDEQMSGESSSDEKYSLDQFKFHVHLARTNKFTDIWHAKRKNKDYVLKIINKERIRGEGLLENVGKELKAFKTLSKHQNIIGYKGTFDNS